MATKVEIVVLGLLAEEPMYGYDLLERFRERGMGFWTELSRASVYQVLKRLEREGLVTGKAQEGRVGPDRRVFRLTRAGRDRLAEGLVAMASELVPYDTDGGVALGFAHVLTASSAKALADARERSARDLLDAVRTELARTASERDAGRAVSIAMMQQQAALAEAELAWLKTYRAALGKVRR
ncbi:MAG: helix-turn-helix transcriptional regulator [Actinomycetota bacterium]